MSAKWTERDKLIEQCARIADSFMKRHRIKTERKRFTVADLERQSRYMGAFIAQDIRALKKKPNRAALAKAGAT